MVITVNEQGNKIITVDYVQFMEGRIALDFIVTIGREGSFLEYLKKHPAWIRYKRSKNIVEMKGE
jgi:hypothetical protein